MLVSLANERGAVLFEADVSDQQLQKIGVIDDVRANVQGKLDDLSALVQRVTTELAGVLGQANAASSHAPSKVELELGIKVDAEGRAFVAKGSAGASVMLKLAWGSDRPQSAG